MTVRKELNSEEKVKQYKNGLFMVTEVIKNKTKLVFMCNYEELKDWYGSYELVSITPVDGSKNSYLVKITKNY